MTKLLIILMVLAIFAIEVGVGIDAEASPQ